MPPVNRVIVGASGSPASLRALRYALDLARHDDTLLIAVFAWTPPGGDLAERRAPCAELRRIWKDAARGQLRDALTAAWGGEAPGGLTVRTLVERGQAGPVLVDIADCPDDLLVIGAGRRGVLHRITAGRVSRYCLSHALCPVLAVPPPALAQEAVHGWTWLHHRHVSVDDVLRERGRSAA